MVLEYLSLVYEGALGDYPGKPMHHIKVTHEDGSEYVLRINAAASGYSQEEALQCADQMANEMALQDKITGLLGLEV